MISALVGDCRVPARAGATCGEFCEQITVWYKRLAILVCEALSRSDWSRLLPLPLLGPAEYLTTSSEHQLSTLHDIPRAVPFEERPVRPSGSHGTVSASSLTRSPERVLAPTVWKTLADQMPFKAAFQNADLRAARLAVSVACSLL